MQKNVTGDGAENGPGLSRIRRRRWYLWAIILLYLPAMGITRQLTPSLAPAMWVFLLWFILLFFVALVAALARCPRCGNYFHMHGMTFLLLRRCLHCQLPINADKHG